MTAHAIERPTSVSYCVFNVVKATGSVRISSFVVTIKGHVKLFQAPIKAKIPTVNNADLISGKIIFTKIASSLAPSILADSMTSIGTANMACLTINTPSADGSGKIKAQKVLTSFKSQSRKRVSR